MLTRKKFQNWKIKNYIKNNKLLLFINSSRITYRNWLETEQLLKQFDLKFYTVKNNICINVLKNSLYKNSIQTINCTVLLSYQKSIKKISLFLKHLPNVNLLLVALTVKINNKIYIIPQFKNLELFSYMKNIKILKNKLIMYNTIPKTSNILEIM